MARNYVVTSSGDSVVSSPGNLVYSSDSGGALTIIGELLFQALVAQGSLRRYREAPIDRAENELQNPVVIEQSILSGKKGTGNGRITLRRRI